MMLRRTTAAAVLAAFITIPLLAQAPRKQADLRKGQGVKAQRAFDQAIDGLQHDLNLRPDQVSQLRSLLDMRRQELQALPQKIDKKSLRQLKEQAYVNPAERKNAKQTLQAAQQQAQAVQEHFLTQFKGILAPDQLTIYEAMVNAASHLGPFRALGLIDGAQARERAAIKGQLKH